MGTNRMVRCAVPMLAVALGSLLAWAAARPHPPGDAQVSVVSPPASKTESPKLAALPPASREEAEALLQPCIGKTVQEVVQLLGLEEAKWHWTNEPPGVLRGASYALTDGRITLYIAEGEPLFRQFSDFFEWDYKLFLGCRVGGIQYAASDIRLDLGPAVPWQWRRP